MIRRYLIALAALLLVGPAAIAERITVVASFSVIGDMLANVGGDRVDLRTIVKAGGDCELYQPTATDVATLASARAVFVNDTGELIGQPSSGPELGDGSRRVMSQPRATLPP